MLDVIKSTRHAIVRDECGTSLIEFAMFAPFVGLMLVGIADFGRGFSERFALEAAAHRTLERAGVGATQTDYTFLRQEAATTANVPLDNVTFRNWLVCDETRMLNYDDVCEQDQQVRRYIYVKIERDFQPSFHWSTGGKVIRISGDAAVRVQ